jgi:flagellar biosynthetic protein FliP
MKRTAARLLLLLALALFAALAGPEALAQNVVADSAPAIDRAADAMAETVSGDEVSASVRLVMIFTAMSFLPAMLLVMTPFTRFVIVFSLLRQALGLQSSPPNQVLIGLSLFLSAMVMGPTLDQVYDEAVQPYISGELETVDAVDTAMAPMRHFMLGNMHREDLVTAQKIARLPKPASLDDIPTRVVVSAFILSELKTAFVIAIKVYVPFLVVDIVVASVLLGMGMMVLPPVIISLPFKLMLFVLMDGWGLLVTSMVSNFNT